MNLSHQMNFVLKKMFYFVLHLSDGLEELLEEIRAKLDGLRTTNHKYAKGYVRSTNSF